MAVPILYENSPFQGHRRGHPDRLKIHIWNVKNQTVKDIRKLLNIENSYIIRSRGVFHLRRLEIWCQTRTELTLLYNKILDQAKKNNLHISIGKTFIDRRKPKTNSEELTNNIKIVQWNARSLRNKLETLKQEIQTTKPSIVCIQETFIEEKLMTKLKFKHYNKVHISRNDKRGGGLLTLVHDSILIVKANANISENGIEYISTDIWINNNNTLTIVNVYIPPTITIDIAELNMLLPTSNNFLILGDFNAKHHTWNIGAQNHFGNVIFKWILDNNIILLNTKEPTYQCASSGTLSALDLTLSSSTLANKISRWNVGQDLQSDHLPVYTTICYSSEDTNTNTIPRTKWKLRDANWTDYKEHLLHTAVDFSKNTDELTDVITNALIDTAHASIPKMKQHKYKPMNIWWTQELTDLRKSSRKARRQWMKDRNSSSRALYNKANAKLKRLIRISKRNSWQTFVTSMNNNTPSSTVWKKFKAIHGYASKEIHHIMDSNKTILVEDFQKAEAFTSHYQNKSGTRISFPKFLTKEEQFLSCNTELFFRHDDISDPSFTMTELQLALSELKPTATGEDNIHNSMLQNAPQQFLELILDFYNKYGLF